MKLLVVEDEPKTGEYLQQGLTEAGFVVDLARNGTDGRHLAMSGDYDLLLLDVMLPSRASCPSLLDPQAYTVPSSVRARPNVRPAAIWTTCCSGSALSSTTKPASAKA